MALTADVPKVSRVAGVGIVKLASLSGRPIFLVAIATSNRIMLKNWDRSAVNLPFGRGAMVGAGPIYVPADADDAALEAARSLIEIEAQRDHRARLRDRRRATPRGRPWLTGCHCRCASTGWHRPWRDCLRRPSSRAGSSRARNIRRASRALRRKRHRPAGRAAGLGARRQRRRVAGGDPADRPHPRAGHQRVVHVRHDDVGDASPSNGCQPASSISSSTLDVPRFVKRFFNHWRPDLALFVESELWPNLIMTGGRARRAAHPGQWPFVGACLQSLAPRARQHRGAAALLRSLPGAVGDLCGAASRSRRAPCRHHRQPQARRAGASRRSRRSRGAAVSDRHTDRHRGSLDACRRGDGADRRTSAAAQHVSPAAHDHCAAPSRARSGHSRNRQCRSSVGRGCARAANCRAPRPTSTSPTPWANWVSFTALRRSSSWEVRSRPTAGRTRSSRPSSAPPFCTVRTSGISPRSIRRSMPCTAPSR